MFMIDSYTGNLLEPPSKDTTVKPSKNTFSTDDRTVAFQSNFDNQRGSLRYQDNDYHLLSNTVVLVTTCLYWSMIESGLALVAACLPANNPSPVRPSSGRLRQKKRCTRTKRSSVFPPEGNSKFQGPSCKHGSWSATACAGRDVCNGCRRTEANARSESK